MESYVYHEVHLGHIVVMLYKGQSGHAPVSLQLGP